MPDLSLHIDPVGSVDCGAEFRDISAQADAHAGQYFRAVAVDRNLEDPE